MDDVRLFSRVGAYRLITRQKFENTSFLLDLLSG